VQKAEKTLSVPGNIGLFEPLGILIHSSLQFQQSTGHQLLLKYTSKQNIFAWQPTINCTHHGTKNKSVIHNRSLYEIYQMTYQ
jgi:hypothetical protein